MKCISKIFVLGILCLTLTGCGKLDYDMEYQVESKVSSFNVLPARSSDTVAESFAADLCVVEGDVAVFRDVDMSKATSAVLFDVNKNEVVYSKNPHEQLHPASLTKIMTALVALKYGSPDQMLTATESVKITESGATLLGLKSGDSMTLDQALHALLMNSSNDVAMLIAENVGGTTERFIDMMNAEAKRLGATNTTFMNPHGLTQEGHTTTAYDLYLIFNEAIKYESFNEIIHMTSYQMTYYDKDGNAKEKTVETTNLFLRDHYSAPENVNVIGGKTGTTKAALSCLALLSKDASGAPYISIILKAETRDILYEEMIDLLDEIEN